MEGTALTKARHKNSEKMSTSFNEPGSQNIYRKMGQEKEVFMLIPSLGLYSMSNGAQRTFQFY